LFGLLARATSFEVREEALIFLEEFHYPRENAELQKRIASEFLVISQCLAERCRPGAVLRQDPTTGGS
jgi:hypothetical protein